MRLKNKRALITGGGSGLGRAMAERFTAEGAAVAIADINKADAQDVVKRLTAKGHKAMCTIGDVSRTADAQRMVQEAVAFLGGLEILVNNAGIETVGSVTSAKEEDWDRQIGVNLRGTFVMSRFGVPEIIKAGGGSVINLGSIGGLVAVKEYSAYGASKAAIVQLTRSMAADYAAHNIRVNSICPGPIDTPMIQRAAETLNPKDPEAIKKLYGSYTMLNRLGKPEEIANCALFLASDEAGYVTGHALVADGGYTEQ
jgi:NAD(P)-dependent dehydrogenase (short-subunit alcohol dehydrogenase family)